MTNYFKCLEVDENFGFESESQTIDLLKEYFKDDKLMKTEDRYCGYDFYSENKRIELKTRRNTSFKFDTTILPIKKLKGVSSFNGTYYFVFKFTNGLFYIKYDESVFKNFKTEMKQRRDRGIIESDMYVMIPIENLTEI